MKITIYILFMAIGSVAAGTTALCRPGSTHTAFDTATAGTIPDTAYIVSGFEVGDGAGYIHRCPYITVTTQLAWSRKIKIGTHGDGSLCGTPTPFDTSGTACIN